MIAAPGQSRARTELLGVGLDCVTESEAIDWVCDRAGTSGGFVVTANLDHLRRCRIDQEYAGLVEQADLVVADGMPLIWASRVRGEPRLPERVAGSTMCLGLCASAAARGLSVFLLGGDPGVAERASTVLKQRYSGLRVVGTYCPPFGFEKDPVRMNELQESVVSADPDLILVALGSPKQERLIQQLMPLIPRACWMGVGISLSFITGDVARAPRWMQRFGLEWVHRLAQEPRRLFSRYVVHGIPWGIYLLACAGTERLWGRRTPVSAALDTEKGRR